MNIIYIKLFNSSFIRVDEEILKENYNLKTILLNPKTPISFFFSIIKLLCLLIYNFFWADVYFTRFADYHASVLTLFSKISRTKVAIVIGGFDVASIPSLKYGAHVKKYRSKLVKYALKHADLLLPNTEALIKYDNKFTGKSIKGGITHFVPNPNAEMKVVYNGFDIDFWERKTDIKKEMIAITVASISNMRTFKLKGIDTFIEVAKLLPEYNFIIVGMSNDFVKTHNIELPKNLINIGFLKQPDLIDYYLKSKVFCLFSISEGMPNVLCEAMLCNCIPVGSQVASIPETIGDSGIVLKEQNIEEIANQLKKAFSLDDDFNQKARKRVVENYSLTRRKKDLVNAINDLN